MKRNIFRLFKKSSTAAKPKTTITSESRDELVRPMDEAHSSPNSILDAIPNDILLVIFDKLLETRSGWERLPPEVILSHVDHRWRSLTLTLPSLWTTIVICSVRQEELVERYLERSLSLPLDVTLDFSGLVVEELMPASSISMVLLHAHRWRSLSIDISHYGNYPRSVFWAIHNVAVPRLRTMRVNAQGGYFDPTYPDNFVFQGGAPALEDLTILGQPLPYCQPPLCNVKSFHFGSPDMSSALFHKMINSLSSIRNLRLDGVRFDPDPNEASCIDLPFLRTLVVHGTIASIFSIINAPGLESLVIENGTSGELSNFALHLQTSSPVRFPSLRLLEFWHSEMPVFALLQLARRLPTVIHFSVIECGRSVYHIPVLLAICDEHTDAAALWPSLETFTFYPRTSCFTAGAFDRVISHFVSVRATAPLFSKLRLNPVIYDSVIESLKQDKQQWLVKLEAHFPGSSFRDGFLAIDWENYLL